MTDSMVMTMKYIVDDKLACLGLCVLILFCTIALFADLFMPYDVQEMHRDENGELKRLQPPSSEHWFGTTNLGRDIFSQVIKGTQTAIFVGGLTALLVTLIGTSVGLVAGYFGGFIDACLMRIVDIVYAIPFIPFVIVLVALMGPSIGNIILGITLLSWRTVARIVRAQVLSITQRPFIKAAVVAGAGHGRIMLRYILPQVLSLVLLEMAFAVNTVIMAEASLSFLGLGDPALISWGQILHTNFLTGNSRTAWWWVFPPGVAMTLLLLSIFFVSRALETMVNPRLQQGGKHAYRRS